MPIPKQNNNNNEEKHWLYDLELSVCQPYNNNIIAVWVF